MSKCETCGSDVEIGGHTTRYYIPVGYQKGIRRAIAIVNQVFLLWSGDFNENVKAYLVDKLEREINENIPVKNKSKRKSKSP